ncbi:MAG TPA: AgmX/PglI C-terminal domain-containing protein [Polyangia bacterium]|nr:AgmX/PglI C-terminal domain-containing protein [Polyangia bacterium]
MKDLSRSLITLLGASMLAATLGCATNVAAQREQEREARAQAWNDKHSAVHSAEEAEAQAEPAPDSESEMSMSGDEGTLNAEDIEAAMNQHRAELIDCYSLGRRSARKAYGRAVLRCFVDGKGEVQDVAILESNIGNRAVEHCLIDIAIGVTLHAPAGRKATTFDYPIEFRPATQPIASARARR